MPCNDWSIENEYSAAKSQEISALTRRLHKRTAQTCLAMRLLMQYGVNWKPKTTKEKKLLKWFIKHQKQDLENQRKKTK